MIIIYCFFSFFILVGLVNYFYYRIREKKYYKAKGMVIDYVLSEDEGTSSKRLYILWYPIVKFRDIEGDIVTIQSFDGNPYAAMFPIGTVVDLLVNPNDNTSFVFDVLTDKLIVPEVCISFGVIGCIYVFLHT